MKKILIITATAALFSVSLAQAALPARIGVFNFWKIWKNDPQVTQMKSQMKEHFVPKGTELKSTHLLLRKDLMQLRGKSMLDAAKDEALRGDIRTNAKKLHGLRMGFKHDLVKTQNESLRIILTNIKEAIARVAKAQNLQLVLTQANVAYSEDTIDITDLIIKELKNSDQLTPLKSFVEPIKAAKTEIKTNTN